GVRRGDRVAILANNDVPWVVAYLGAIAEGAVAAPLNTRHAQGDLDGVLGHVDPAVILVDPVHLPRLAERYRRLALVSTDLDLEPALAQTRDGSEARPREVGVLCQTSGTTGEPRGVMIRNESLVRNAQMFAHLFQSGPDSATAVVC